MYSFPLLQAPPSEGAKHAWPNLRKARAAAVLTAAPSDLDACVEILTRGFVHDPGVRWMYADADRFRAWFPRFARAFGGAAFEHGTAYRTGANQAAALWLPPGVHPDEAALGAVLEASIPADRQGAAFELFDRMAACHPREPHWHLPLIATDPAHQGRGHGSALLRHVLARCDALGDPAYLEATSPRNAALYARHGFEALCSLEAGGSPPIIPMLRTPKRIPAT